MLSRYPLEADGLTPKFKMPSANKIRQSQSLWAGDIYSATKEKKTLQCKTIDTLDEQKKRRSLNSFKLPIGLKVVKKEGSTKVTLKTFEFGSIRL